MWLKILNKTPAVGLNGVPPPAPPPGDRAAQRLLATWGVGDGMTLAFTQENFLFYLFVFCLKRMQKDVDVSTGAQHGRVAT